MIQRRISTRSEIFEPIPLSLNMHDISFLYEDATRFRQHFGLFILPHFNTHFNVVSHATRGKRLDFTRSCNFCFSLMTLFLWIWK